jgi:hypothetical protein
MRRANQHADYTSSGPSVIKRRQFADLAAQQKLGLLSKWGLGLGCRCSAYIVASWESLKRLDSRLGNSVSVIVSEFAGPEGPSNEAFQISEAQDQISAI